MSFPLGDVSGVTTVLFRFCVNNTGRFSKVAKPAHAMTTQKSSTPEFWTKQDRDFCTRLAELWQDLVKGGYRTGPVTIRSATEDHGNYLFVPMTTEGEHAPVDVSPLDFVLESMWRYTSIVHHPEKQLLVICGSGRQPYFKDDRPEHGPLLNWPRNANGKPVTSGGPESKVIPPHAILRFDEGKLVAHPA